LPLNGFAILGGATARNTLFRAQISDFWNERSLANSGKQRQQRTSAVHNSVHFGIPSAFEVPIIGPKMLLMRAAAFPSMAARSDALPNVGAAKPRQVFTQHLKRLRRTDNRPSNV
jgi:hypothetical protein